MKGWGIYLIYMAGVMVCAFAALYIGLVFKTVYYTAGTERIHTAMSAKTASIGTLESQYVALESNIDQTTVAKLGFTDVSAKSYISEPSESLSFR